MERTIRQRPIQKLSIKEKNDEWRNQNVDYIIGAAELSSSLDLPDDEEIQTNYDLYNGLYDEREIRHVTNPFKQEDGFPAMAQDYNIIRPKIDLLIGEETKRPFNFRVYRTSNKASSEVMTQAKEMLTNYVMGNIMSKMGEEEAQRFQEALASGEIMPPEEIAKYLTQDYKDVAESTAYHSLNYLKQKLNLEHEFLTGWEDALKAGLEYFYVGIRNGEPYVECVNPLEFKWAISDGIEFVHEAEWCRRRMLLSASQIHDMLYDKLSEEDFNKILDMTGQSTAGGFGPDKGPKDDFNHWDVKSYSRPPGHNPFSDTAADALVVYHVCWRSYKKIGFVIMIDPTTGQPIEYQVDETYKKTGDELSVEWTWLTEIWEGYRIGDDLYVGIQPVEYQYYDNNLNSKYLPYTGAAYSNRNSKGVSLISVMKPLQYFYIITWYRLELAIARDKGKVVNMDITQIPTSMGVDVNKWLHYLSSVGVNFVNPYEEGWLDEQAHRDGKPAQFNQMTAMDLSTTQSIVQYIEIMNKIEQMLDSITGISRERQGGAAPNALVGVVERNNIQSANITEPLFWRHNQVKKHVLTLMLNTAKAAWRNTDKRYLHYILDDTTRAFLEIGEDFPYEDFDIFVHDGTRDLFALEQIRQLIQPAMQNGASLIDVIDIITQDNISMLKHKMEEIESARQERENAMAEREQQVQMEIENMKQRSIEMSLADKQADRDLQKYKIDTEAATRIAVAEINAYRGSENLDQDMNGIPDPIEIANLRLAERAADANSASTLFAEQAKMRETELKTRVEERKAELQERSEKIKAKIEKDKIELEEKKIKATAQLQKQKDQEAYRRELLKAKTAVKNKVTGEK
jgi:hypothetical protein